MSIRFCPIYDCNDCRFLEYDRERKEHYCSNNTKNRRIKDFGIGIPSWCKLMKCPTDIPEGCTLGIAIWHPKQTVHVLPIEGA